jgi:hypothetical protein
MNIPQLVALLAHTEPAPEGTETADLVFFKVWVDPKNSTAMNVVDLKTLIKQGKQGVFTDVDLFDGKEHSYIELGAWIGDQGLALRLMGLGALLGFWKLLTPKSVLGKIVDDDMERELAGRGMVTIVAAP